MNTDKQPFFNYYKTMIVDKLENLEKFLALSIEIKNLDEKKGKTLDSPKIEFLRNSKKIKLFVVKEGCAAFSTTWRECYDSMEVTGIIKLDKDSFALYLPSEPYLVRTDGAKVIEYDLE